MTYAAGGRQAGSSSTSPDREGLLVLSVQYMRAVAALLVVIHHCAWKGRQYSTDPWGWFTVGECGVDLFFIISGYIMCRATSGRRVGFLAFMRARVLRILPLYWLLSLIALGVYLVAPHWVNSQGGETKILDSFTLWPSGARFLINNGWTLSYEFLFYLIFGLGLLLPVSLKQPAPALIIVLLVTLGRWLPAGSHAIAFLTHPLLLEFAMGIAAYLLLSRARWNRWWSFAAISAGVAGLLWVNVHGPIGNRPFYFGVPCALLFVGSVGMEDYFVQHRTAPLSRWMHAIGDSSYSLYLVHAFALGAGVLALRAIGLTRSGHLFALALAAVSLAAGLACFRWVEQPLSRLLKSSTTPRQPGRPSGPGDPRVLNLKPEPPVQRAPVETACESSAGRQRAAVRTFYEEVGWRSTEDEAGFEDGRRFDIVSPETADYVQDCHRRVAEVLEPEGTLFLDAASGPVQFAEYREYSRGFHHRVCVDLSLRALHSARARLGDHALCVQADVARLPFREGSFRAGVSLNTIYHVPADDQAAAFRELDRVAAPGGRIAVAYSWGKFSALMLLPDALPTKLASLFQRRARSGRGEAGREPELYFHPRSPWWFRREVAPHVDAEMRVWRSLSVPFLRTFVPPGRAGRALLRLVYALECRFPRLAGWLGQYPLIVLRGRTPPTAR